MEKFNAFVAKVTSKILSSMWLFWLLLVVLIVLWILHPPRTAFEVALFVISTGFQAIALPVLAFVSKIEGDRQEKIAKETLSLTLQELDLIKEQLSMLRKEHADTKELLSRIPDNDPPEPKKPKK